MRKKLPHEKLCTDRLRVGDGLNTANLRRNLSAGEGIRVSASALGVAERHRVAKFMHANGKSFAGEPVEIIDRHVAFRDRR